MLVGKLLLLAGGEAGWGGGELQFVYKMGEITVLPQRIILDKV